MKASITYFSGKLQGTSSSESNSGREAPIWGAAGNYFGGRASKRTKDWLEIPPALALFDLIILIKF